MPQVATVWQCHYCRLGYMLIATHPACVECGHILRGCLYCRLVAGRPVCPNADAWRNARTPQVDENTERADPRSSVPRDAAPSTTAPSTTAPSTAAPRTAPSPAAPSPAAPRGAASRGARDPNIPDSNRTPLNLSGQSSNFNIQTIPDRDISAGSSVADNESLSPNLRDKTQLLNIAEELTIAFAQHSELRNLLTSFLKPNLSANDAFRKRLVLLIRQYASELKSEASTRLQWRAYGFVKA
jgi:hypothetical protein